MPQKTINTEQGHWMLAKMGKKVLRPGGRELTEKLINDLSISEQDKIVEFAPGIGYTAKLLLTRNPKDYTGVEINKEAARYLGKKLGTKTYRTIINANAAASGLKSMSKDKVIGEAMLSMQADHRKMETIREAYRILKPRGLYGIHELGLKPDNLAPGIKKKIQRELAQAVHINARPLTESEWSDFLKKAGFTIKQVITSPMHLLEPQRLLQDEGLFGAMKFGFNITTHPKERKQMREMREVFRKYGHHLTAFALIAEK